MVVCILVKLGRGLGCGYAMHVFILLEMNLSLETPTILLFRILDYQDPKNFTGCNDLI